MIRYQFIFVISIFLSISGCQSDAPKNSVKEITEDAGQATKKVANGAKNQVKEVLEPAESKPESPKLREFYVEEDKSKKEPSKASSKINGEQKVDASTAKVASKEEAKPKPKHKKAPKLKFTNNTHAFGVIKPGEVIEHKFEFINTGSADLVITDAKATCGCTQPSFPFVPIPPGEKGYIGVKYDSTGKLGTQKPTVTLTTNAYPKTQKVYLEGMVISELAKKQ